MIVRCAYLEGSVRPEHRSRFDAFINAEIVPLMKQFPGATSVRVMRANTIEEEGPSLYMTFETVYPSVEAMEQAFAQPVRRLLRQKLREIKPLFEGRVFHITQTLLADASLPAQ
ncbi:conserved hypothetical protein [Cupriavidus taiwanensis]|uniref:Uncharacterized protein n=1 Tax=Cupriavidus taiwanensis TaxID=164546 RepID=A0A976A925_9BURK|nr:hypothetical protein [Cupriavidus taiwanensis]SOY68873.1 conserved hypothetical protein [Cupriavidus taiwanensis]